MIEIEEAINSSSEKIFQNHTLSDITDLSQSLTKASKDKHEELRTLVASQYRDLLQTADQIIGMNALALQSDKELYELSFMSNARLDKNMNIEKSVDIFVNDHEVVMEDRSYVERKGDLFLEMSKLLNLGVDDGVDEIIHVLTNLPKDEWFDEKKDVIEDKLLELQVIVLQKVKGMSMEELIQLDGFIQESWFDKELIEDEIYESLIGLITLENLSFVLMKFTKFKPLFETKYQEEVDMLLKEIHLLMTSIDDKGVKLDLYSTELDDDYLEKIQFLTNGLVYDNYQQISIDITHCLQTLKYLQVINESLYIKYKNEIHQVIKEFKQHATDEDNKPLVRYLQTLS